MDWLWVFMALFEDDLVIDDMKDGDLIEVMGIENEAFSDPWTIDMFYSELFNSFSRIWAVREKSGNLTGYICFWRGVDEVHILNLAVKNHYRRKDGVKSVLLEVRRSNMAAQELYIKFGFSVILSRTRYYKNPVEDALVMALEL